MGVNVRAAYIACHYALPHMVKQKWGHVLNMCPRLPLRPSPGKVAYMISKLGMAYVALGLAAEHATDNIAGNTLWPRTIIESQASINWNMADRSQWRTPEILCDASMAIFAQEPHSLHRPPVDRRGGAHGTGRHHRLRPLLVRRKAAGANPSISISGDSYLPDTTVPGSPAAASV